MNRKKQLILEIKLKYGDRLTNRQAMEVLGLDHGRELGAMLHTDRLPSLRAEDVAKAMQPKPRTIKERLFARYGKESLTLPEMAFELSLSHRETVALLRIGILKESTASEVERFLEDDLIQEKLRKRKFIKLLYWEQKLTDQEIGNILGITYNMARKLIKQHNLTKKDHGIPIKGKIGYKMPIEERVKHHYQKNNRAIVVCDIATLQIVKRYRSINAVADDGFTRNHARRSAKGMWTAVHRNGYPRGIYGVVRGKWKFFFEDGFISKREELIEELRKIIWMNDMSIEEVRRVFGFGDGLIREIM